MPSTKGVAIAIDGPAGSGKSTVGRGLAQRLGYRFVDTGVMYRAVTRAALDNGIPLTYQTALARAAKELGFGWPKGAKTAFPRIAYKGTRLRGRIFGGAVDQAVSQVAAVPGVRRELVRQQRALAKEGGTVMVGRDIGTVVLPRAKLKIYLEASAEERARRRRSEMQEKGPAPTYEAVLAEMRRRDKLDSERAVSPLRPAEDAQRVDTDGLSIEQVIDHICALLNA